MNRVVVTGMGIRSPIGNDLETVTKNLREGNSGIKYNSDYAAIGLKCHVSGSLDFHPADLVHPKDYRWMGPTAALGYLSCVSAIEDAGLKPNEVSNPDTGCYFGSGAASPDWQQHAEDVVVRKGPARDPTIVFKTMNSTTSANITKALKIYGEGFTISSACSSSLHCIGEAYRTIAHGYQKRMIVGGSDNDHYAMVGMLDALRALSSKYNDNPSKASRAYDKDRDGFVVGEGSGALILEDYDTAIARGAKIYAEIAGYGATSDGYDMAHPSGEGAVRCMSNAMSDARRKGYTKLPDYMNAHGTSTPVGDITELNAIKAAFHGADIPPISSTKSLTGHGLGSAGVWESIFSILMMNQSFIAGSANIDEIDPRAAEFPIARESFDAELDSVITNSFGFGGANATVIYKKV